MKTIPVSLVLIGVLTPLMARAQDQESKQNNPGGKGFGKREAQRLWVETWKKADKDGDGVISRTEFDAMPRIQKLPEDKRQDVFERLDKNRDGKIDRGDLHHMDHKPDGQFEPRRRLAELDTDKSGGVSMEEFQAGPFFQKLPADRRIEIFNRLDTDGDGMISPKDRPQFPGKPEGGMRPKPDDKRMQPERFLRMLDKDSDGAVSFDEFRVGPQVSSLSEDEQEDRFEAMDRNKDKKLTLEDFPKPEKP